MLVLRMKPLQKSCGGYRWRDGTSGGGLTTKAGQSLSEGLSKSFQGYGHTFDALTGNKAENPRDPKLFQKASAKHGARVTPALF